MTHSTGEKDPVLGRAIGKIPSGVYVLCARAADGTHTAMLASWVQQASFSPPTVSVAMAKDRPAYDVIRRAGAFALSILADGDTHFMKKYARGVPPGQDPFDGVRTNTTPAGQPYLADALAWIECRLAKTLEFGADHDILIGQVVGGQVLKEGQSFMHVRGSGWHY